MTTNILKTRIKHRIDTAANWANSIEPPLKGEFIIYQAEGDIPAKLKIGDGIHTASNLPFITDVDMNNLSAGVRIPESSDNSLGSKTQGIYWENGRPKLLKGPGKYTVPAFWRPAVAAVVNAVRENQNTAGADAINFALMSDMHVHGNDENYTRNIGHIVAAVMDKANIPMAINCGDLLTNDSVAKEEWVEPLYERAWEYLEPIKDRLLLVQGNHDGAWGAYTEDDISTAYQKNISPDKLWQYLFRPQGSALNRTYGHDGSYFYVDNIEQKMRFICLNSQDGEWSQDANGNAIWNTMTGGYTEAQLNWLANIALNVKEGWTIAIVSHTPPTAKLPTDYSTIRCTDLVRGIVTAYNQRSKFEGSYYFDSSRGEGIWANASVSVDFTEARGEIAAWFSGHAHRDAIVEDDLPFPIINITCSSNISYDDTEADRVLDTATETALDFVTIDKYTRTIYLTRLGTGENRICHYMPAGQNMLPIATDDDGNIYNGIGYAEGYRISVSGNSVSTNAATDLTGYIPFEIGDTIVLSNIIMPEKTANIGVHFFPKQDVTTRQYSMVGWDSSNGFPGINWEHTMHETNVVSFTIPNWEAIRGAKYLRLVASDIGEHSAVIVKKPMVEYGEMPITEEPCQMLVTDVEGNTMWENRTHWEENTVMLSETQVYGDSDNSEWPITTPFVKVPKDGDSYTVNWNGVEYSGVARTVEQDGVSFTMLGNLSAIGLAGADDNGQPFIVAVFPDEYVEVFGAQGAVMPLDGSESPVTVSIRGGEVHKIPDKFINYPDSDVLIVDCTSENFDMTTLKPDKTYEQVEEAFNAGRIVIFRLFGMTDVRVCGVSGGSAYAYMNTPTNCIMYQMHMDQEYLEVEETRTDRAVGLVFLHIGKNGQMQTALTFSYVKEIYTNYREVICRFTDEREGSTSYLPLVSYNEKAETAVFGLATNERYIKVTYIYNDNTYEYLPLNADKLVSSDGSKTVSVDNTGVVKVSNEEVTQELATQQYIQTYITDLGLSSALKFGGIVANLPATSEVGTVVLKDKKEYIYNTDNNWVELGDEGSHALKTIKVTANAGLTGGGTLASDITIGHSNSIAAGTAQGSSGSLSHGGTFTVPKITYDAYGHITNATTTTYTLPSDSNTHYTANLYLGASGASSNATSAVSNPYLVLRENNTTRNNIQLKGDTGISISGVSGVATIGHTNSITAATAQGSATGTLSFGGTFTIPTITYDAQGHITGKGTTTLTMPTNPNTDTHWTANLITGASATATANAAASDGSVYLNLVENGSVRNSHLIDGTGTVTVSSDANGKITINGSAHPTVNNAKITLSAGTGLTGGGDFTLNQSSAETISFGHSNSVTADTAQGGSGQLSHGGTFTVPTITYDAQGHITAKGTTTYTLPTDNNTDTKVTQAAAITTNGSYPVLLAYSTVTTAVTNTVNKTSTLLYNPSTGTLSATKFSGNGNALTNLNAINLQIASNDELILDCNL